LGGIYYGIGKMIQKKEEKIIEKNRGYQKWQNSKDQTEEK
jgi:hypothetical protein